MLFFWCLPEKKAKRMVEDAQMFWPEDERHSERVKMRNSFLKYAHQVKRTLTAGICSDVKGQRQALE